jgi:uncharacterized protein (TIGR02145 family)
MKKLLFLIMIFCALKANAQNYLISFTGEGASSSVSSVKVENLMKGTVLTVNGNDILHLTIATIINSIDDNQSSELKIYPNPMTYNSTLQIYPPVAGNAVITILDMTGKPVAQIQSNLENIRQDFRLSGIKNGFYLVNVKGNSYQFSGKLLSNVKSNGPVSIEKVNNRVQALNEKAEKTDSKGTQATVDMAYSPGDRLKFTGISGDYSTVVIDIPAESKTITFNYIACTDDDLNNYAVVKIGTQVWMAENLKTTKYNDNTEIPLVTDNVTWGLLSTPGYCWYNNDAATYKATYGALYNWFVLDAASNGGKNVCPTGWHVSTNAEWTTMKTYLGGDVGGIKIKETGHIHWLTHGDMVGTNESGYTALPGSYRVLNGTFGNIGVDGNWWSSTEWNTLNAFGWTVAFIGGYLFSTGFYKQYGQSVRCVRD